VSHNLVTAFSIKKYDDYLIETHENCRKYKIMHVSRSLDQKNAVVFDRRTLSSDLPGSLHSSGHHSWQWSASGFLQATQLISRAAPPAECHSFVPVMHRLGEF